MPRAVVGDIELEYDAFGDGSDEALLLIAGAGSQMLFWREDFCEALAARGFHVIRYDNRDVGLSTSFEHLGVPDLEAVKAGEERPPYTLDDMTADAIGLLDVLGIERAHVVGMSMGGYIAQLMAIRHPERVLSLASMGSALNGEDQVPPTPDMQARRLAPPPATAEEAIQFRLDGIRLISGPHFDEATVREFLDVVMARSGNLSGGTRHSAAILAAPSRREALASVRVPALVVHGALDPLLPPENGERTAAAIPGARLLVLPDAGHELPPPVWDTVIEAITETARKATSRR